MFPLTSPLCLLVRSFSDALSDALSDARMANHWRFLRTISGSTGMWLMHRIHLAHADHRLPFMGDQAMIHGYAEMWRVVWRVLWRAMEPCGGSYEEPCRKSYEPCEKPCSHWRSILDKQSDWKAMQSHWIYRNHWKAMEILHEDSSFLENDLECVRKHLPLRYPAICSPNDVRAL